MWGLHNVVLYGCIQLKSHGFGQLRRVALGSAKKVYVLLCHKVPTPHETGQGCYNAAPADCLVGPLARQPADSTIKISGDLSGFCRA